MSRRFWSELVGQLEPYTPGEQPQLEDLLKLNTNESPYPPSPQVLAALQALDGVDMLRYPDPASTALREEIAAYHGLDTAQVFVGNGSDEVLAHVFMGLLKHHRELLFPDISYSFYPVWCQLHAIHYRQVPLREDFRIAPEDYSSRAAAMIVPNPNAPTGLPLALEDIRRCLTDAPDRLLVVDEAYVDFGADSAVPLIGEFDNLLVVQTLSKSRALAGMRVGLALGPSELIEALERVKDSFNSYPLDVAAQRAAAAAYRDREWFETHCAMVVASRERLAERLRALDFEVVPSAANFLFVRHLRHPGKQLFDRLREQGIILRRWDRDRISDYLRISIGTDAQCDRLLGALEELLQGRPE